MTDHSIARLASPPIIQDRMNRRNCYAGAMAAAFLFVGTTGALAADDLGQFSKHTAGSKSVVDHATWTVLLKKYVVAGDDGLNRVRYGAFKREAHDALKAYVQALEGVRPVELDRPEQFAYWANLYNAKTIDVVLDAYPVKSIKDISIGGGLVDFLKKSVGAGGPWKAKVVTVSGQKLSLDDIEHGIMRPVFRDPRVHYAVNCASIGCPNLQRSAFTGAALEEMLNRGAQAYVNSSRGFAFVDGEVVASSIYSWFQVDFGGNARSVLSHAQRYADPKLKARLSAAENIASYRYDWSLNDVAK